MSRFIVLEGIDGAGTTTQQGNIVRWLTGRGLRVTATREPTNRQVGQVIRATLQKREGAPSKDCLPWLFAADRADHMDAVVKPRLRDGAWVVSDRYYHSSLAYQTLVMPFDDVLALNATFPIPHLTLFLKLDFKVALERIKSRSGTREIFETAVILEKVANQYEEVNRRLRARGDTIINIKADQPEDDVFRDIQAAIRTHAF